MTNHVILTEPGTTMSVLSTLIVHMEMLWWNRGQPTVTTGKPRRFLDFPGGSVNTLQSSPCRAYAHRRVRQEPLDVEVD